MASLKIRLWIAVMAGVALSSEARAQATTAFEVASIRRNLSGGQNTRINLSGGRLTVTNASVKTLICNAYDLLSFQLTGGPGWLDTNMYDIVATMGSGEKITKDQLRVLLKNSLSDRFQLRVPVGNEGSADLRAGADQRRGEIQRSSSGREPGINTQKGPGKVLMKGTSEPVSILASNPGNQPGRFVVDKTGLPGVYDWVLEWDPDPTPESTRPSLFTALQQQLALRLEGQRGPVEILVIDSAEKSSDNLGCMTRRGARSRVWIRSCS